MELLQKIDFFCLENALWVAEKKVNVPTYDFCFSPLFQVTRPREENTQTVVARLGAIDNYQSMYDALLAIGFKLINSPTQHLRASELENWYPIIQEFTPRSMVFEQMPTPQEIMQYFDFPVFIKGNRQTAKHNLALAIARNLTELQRILKAYRQNNILHWQKLVCREFVPLKKLDYQMFGTVPLSFEFRTFWWQGQLAGKGHYWAQHEKYNWTPTQQAVALSIAAEVVRRLAVPFIVIDLALTAQGEWIIIECNDGQESGYCGINPGKLWKNVIEIAQKSRHPSGL